MYCMLLSVCPLANTCTCLASFETQQHVYNNIIVHSLYFAIIIIIIKLTQFGGKIIRDWVMVKLLLPKPKLMCTDVMGPVDQNERS